MEATRNARVDDIPHVVDLARLLHAELAPTRGGALWARREWRPEPLEEAYVGYLGDERSRFVVGTVHDAVVGFAVVELERLPDGGLLGRVAELFVEPEARGVGVGEAMMDTIVEFCTGQGCIGIDAFVLPGHRAAKNFFEESGFTARAIVMHRAGERAQ